MVVWYVPNYLTIFPFQLVRWYYLSTSFVNNFRQKRCILLLIFSISFKLPLYTRC